MLSVELDDAINSFLNFLKKKKIVFNIDEVVEFVLRDLFDEDRYSLVFAEVEDTICEETWSSSLEGSDYEDEYYLLEQIINCTDPVKQNTLKKQYAVLLTKKYSWAEKTMFPSLPLATKTGMFHHFSNGILDFSGNLSGVPFGVNHGLLPEGL